MPCHPARANVFINIQNLFYIIIDMLLCRMFNIIFNKI